VILKKLADSITRQDWFSVCVEILIVVIGIYLGLQANQWSQDREDRESEIIYLERISEDLHSSVRQTQNAVAFQRRHAGYGALVVDSLDACELPLEDRDRFASGIYLAGKYITAPFVKATIEELLSARRTKIIRNAALRQEIIGLLGFHDQHLFYMSDVQLRTAPHVSYIDSVARVDIREAIGGGSDIAWERLRANFSDLCADQRFFTAVSATMNYTWDSTDSLEAWARQLSMLRDAIESELVSLRGTIA